MCKFKNGFTLIELLGVVILLSVISLISMPIILNAIKEAQESADLSSAELIENSGHNYYAESLLDETKSYNIENAIDIYPELNIMNKPEYGQLYVNKNNQVAMAIIINNKCYKKFYTTNIEIVSVNDCDLGYMGEDDINPTVSQEVINADITKSGWYNQDLFVKINVVDKESGVFGYKRCMSQSECEPDDTIYTIDKSIYINTESLTNFICVIGVDNKGNESEKNCVVYKLDKKIPEIMADNYINVDKGANHIVKDDLTVKFGISGGSVICDKENISSLGTGVNEVSCTAIGNNELSNEKTINYLIDDNVQSGVTNNTIENINVWSQFGTKKTYSLGDATVINEGSTSSYTKSGYMAYSFDSNTGQVYLSDYQTKTYPIPQGSGYLNSWDYFYSKSGNNLNVTYVKYWKTISYTNYRIPIIENISIDTGLSYKLKDWTLVNSGESSSYTVSNKYSSYSFDSGTGEIYLSGYTSSKTYPTGNGENSWAYYYYKVGDTLYCLYLKYWQTVSWDLYSTTVEENDNPTTSYSLGDAVLLSENEYSSYTVNGLYAGYSFDSGSGTVYLSNYTQGKTYPTGNGENSWAYYYNVVGDKLYVTYIKYWKTVSVSRYEIPIVEDDTPRFTSTSVYSIDSEAYPDNDYSGDYYYDLMASGLSTAIYINKKPISQIAQKGSNVLFSVELSNEVNNYNKITYQWYKSIDGSNTNGEKLEGETNPQLSLIGDSSNYYYCEITNTIGQYSEKLVTNAAYLKIIE